MVPSPDYMIRALKKGCPECKIVVLEYQDDRREEFYTELMDTTALLTGFLKIEKEVMDHAPGLKVISIMATGYDNVDIEEATRRGIGVCPVGEYCTKDVAEHTIALMLALNKNLKAYTYDIEKRYQWNFNNARAPIRIEEQTLGIFGLGKIGRQVAKLAKGLGMKVIAHDPYVSEETANELEVVLMEADDVYTNADVVTNHMNLSEKNRAYFTSVEFAKMKRNPIFLNMGRGLSVNEKDLADALDQGIVRAAGLDVLTDETPNLQNHILSNRENVIITPHAAFFSESSFLEMQRISCENVTNFLNGKKEEVFKLVN